MKLPEWNKLPNKWIEGQGLCEFKWGKGAGADNLAGLMVLTVILNHCAPDTGIARLTYDELTEVTSLSRALLARGLDVLASSNLIERKPDGRSSYRVGNYDPNGGWAKFPARGLYVRGRVAAFANFQLRQRAELDAMKLYFLFASRRDRQSNMALLGYDKIEEYSGVSREHIKRGLTLLGANSLIHVEYVRNAMGNERTASAYRLVHLHSRQHMGTSGRSADPLEVSRA